MISSDDFSTFEKFQRSRSLAWIKIAKEFIEIDSTVCIKDEDDLSRWAHRDVGGDPPTPALRAAIAE